MLIQDAEGEAKSGEMVGILGPSGCGKTTLLTLLAKRCKYEAQLDINSTIRANNQCYTADDFCRFGAYVQQDDILYSYHTPEELFTFACHMRTKLGPKEVKARVQSLLQLLNLQSCQSTIIGNELSKGVSGGERKRASIGYELITNPSLLILDEPTSGLDSSTA